VILVDSPPVLPVSDALVLSQHADATIVVGQAHRTTQRSLRRAVTLLRQVGSPIVGAVFNRADAAATYGYGYGYGYGAPPASPGRRTRPLKSRR
jgi:tyrosine-protein kinase Etk/Wzc